MKKVRCYDPQYLREEKKRRGYNCRNFDRDKKICLAKTFGGGKPATMFPAKPRKCDHYVEKND